MPTRRSSAGEVTQMRTQEQFSAVFKNSPMQGAKLRGLKRNAALVLVIHPECLVGLDA